MDRSSGISPITPPDHSPISSPEQGSARSAEKGSARSSEKGSRRSSEHRGHRAGHSFGRRTRAHEVKGGKRVGDAQKIADEYRRRKQAEEAGSTGSKRPRTDHETSLDRCSSRTAEPDSRGFHSKFPRGDRQPIDFRVQRESQPESKYERKRGREHDLDPRERQHERKRFKPAEASSSKRSHWINPDEERRKFPRFLEIHRACIESLAKYDVKGFEENLKQAYRLLPEWENDPFSYLGRCGIRGENRKKMIQLEKLARSMEFSKSFHQCDKGWPPEYGNWTLNEEAMKQPASSDVMSCLAFASSYLQMEQLHHRHPSGRDKRLVCAQKHLDWCRETRTLLPPSYGEWFRAYVVTLERMYDPKFEKGREDPSVRKTVDTIYEFKNELLACRTREQLKEMSANLVEWAYRNNHSFYIIAGYWFLYREIPLGAVKRTPDSNICVYKRRCGCAVFSCLLVLDGFSGI